MKKRLSGILSLLGLAGAYLVLRYPLLFLHGMFEWPLDLFAFGAVIIVLSGIVFCGKLLPIFTVSGYVIGFFAGYVFQADYGMGLNNLWIIWTCVYLGAVLAGAAAEIILHKRLARI